MSGRHFDWSTNLSGRQNNASYPGETGGLFANFAIFDIIKLEKLVAHRKMFVGMSRLVAAVIILLLFVSFAAAKARVALVIGNSSYQHVPELPNPKNDAATVAAKLKSIGFEVIEGRDLTLVELRRSVRDFIDRLSGAELGLFYYAGHGLQVNGRNYLAPVDARLETYDDLDFEAFPIDLVLSAMERKTKTNLVFLDACRNNPLARNLARSMGTRSTDVGRGLARISSGVGTLISFSTQPGNVALDGTGRNSPFTTALVRHIGTPGEDISRSMRKVRNDVLNVTDGNQVPWENSSLTGDVILVAEPSASESAVKATAAPASDTSAQVEITYWNSIKNAGRMEFFQSYLVKYPQGLFADIARLKIADFEIRASATEKSAPSQRPSESISFETKQAGAQDNPINLPEGTSERANAETEVAALAPGTEPPSEVGRPEPVKPSLAAQNYERANRIGTKRGWQLFVRKYGADRLYGPLAFQKLGLARGTGDRDARNAEVENYLRLGHAEKVRVQTALNERGYAVGIADGALGPKTRSAIRDFQLASGVSNTGFVDHTLLELLRIDLEEVGTSEFWSSQMAKRYSADDLAALGEDERIVDAIRCLGRVNVIYGSTAGKAYLAVKTGFSTSHVKQLAEKCGGYVVAINSARENRFVYDMISSDEQFFTYGNTTRYSDKHGPLIGLMQEPGSREPKGGWRWTNGNRVTYSNWHRGNPDNHGGDQNFGKFFAFRNGKVDMKKVRADQWDDVQGVDSSGFIMEID